MRRVRRETLPVIVAGEIERDIKNGTFKPGDRLPAEIELSERLGVSRPAIREALRILQGAGLVQIRFSEGAYVGASTVPDGHRGYITAEEMRELLVAEVAQLRREGVALPRHLAELTIDDLADWEHRRLSDLYAELTRYRDDFGQDNEPSSLSAIEERAPGFRFPRNASVIHAPDVDERVLRSVVGRIVGCIAGKPVEGWTSQQIAAYANRVGVPLIGASEHYPLFPVNHEQAHAIGNGVSLAPDADRCSPPLGGRVPRDDDIDYTLLAVLLVERYGDALSTRDVAVEWMERLPFGQVFTAERQAYRNLVMGAAAEEAADSWNPYRELIGAQIRADVYGLTHPGDPATAARLAAQDAMLSHRKNGVYGAMFVAALYAVLHVESDVERAIAVAASFIPPTSRAKAIIDGVLSDARAGKGYWDRLAGIEDTYGYEGFEFVNVLPNLAIVVSSLLAVATGEYQPEHAIRLAVAAGYDTDCNGATVGGLSGLSWSSRAIPEAIDRVVGGRDAVIDSSVFGAAGNTPRTVAERILRVLGHGPTTTVGR